VALFSLLIGMNFHYRLE